MNPMDEPRHQVSSGDRNAAVDPELFPNEYKRSRHSGAVALVVFVLFCLSGAAAYFFIP
jgi:hypothetical protein